MWHLIGYLGSHVHPLAPVVLLSILSVTNVNFPKKIKRLHQGLALGAILGAGNVSKTTSWFGLILFHWPHGM